MMKESPIYSSNKEGKVLMNKLNKNRATQVRKHFRNLPKTLKYPTK